MAAYLSSLWGALPPSPQCICFAYCLQACGPTALWPCSKCFANISLSKFYWGFAPSPAHKQCSFIGAAPQAPVGLRPIFFYIRYGPAALYHCWGFAPSPNILAVKIGASRPNFSASKFKITI